MAKSRQHHHHNPESASPGFHRAYWRTAHRDWRLWVAVILMLVAMFTYVMSDDLSWLPYGRPQPAPAAPAAN